MKNKEKRDELYEIETTIKEKGKDEYFKYVNNNRNDYWNYIISKRISAFRHGLYQIRNYSVTPISENSAKFLNTAKITNQDYMDIIDIYKDNENVFVYIDPPYLDSYNATYNKYQDKNTDKEII